jgi:predicted GTPase
MTLVLVGETGAGKTAFMNFLANVCKLRDPSNYQTVHQKQNEAGGNKSQSQTQSPLIYNFEAPNLTIKIMDTPGFADTRGLDMDEAHRKEITRVIKEQGIERLDAVLVLANGTFERLSTGMNLSLHTIGTMFPVSLVENTGFLYTNVTSELDRNVQLDSIPRELRNCESWTLQNPIAQHAKWQETASRTNDPRRREQLKAGIFRCHEAGLRTIEELLKWIDERDSIPTKEIAELADKRTELELKMGMIIDRVKTLESKLGEIRTLKDDEQTFRSVRIVCTNH